MRWDIFCRVIDNYGDAGVCWRLAVNLAQRGQTVRLWVDDASALAWMAPEGAPSVQVMAWQTPLALEGITPGDVLVEAFGCEVAPEYIAIYAQYTRARGQKYAWINLEYLTAEGYAARCHGLPSPVMSGPGIGLTKHFFYPGFTSDTGGLLREADLLTRQASFDRNAWLAQRHLTWPGKPVAVLPDEGLRPRLVSLFCYEPAHLGTWLKALANDIMPTWLLVTAGRSAAAVRQILQNDLGLQPGQNQHKALSVSYLPALSQTEFDHLLWACDLNFVRGEDSLVRALWAGKPLIWQIYPQDDHAHHAKLRAFLDWLQAPPSLRQAHACWNDLLDNATPAADALWAMLSSLDAWQSTFSHARQTLLKQRDLADSLLQFVAKTH